MGRPPKPWYWSQKGYWCVTLDGKRIRLAKDKDAAHDKFYEIMADRPAPLSGDSLVVVMDELVEWTRKNRAAGTLRFYKEHAQNFVDWLADQGLRDIGCDELTVDIVESFLDEIPQGRRSGAVQVIKRVYNWANKRGRIKVNPIRALEKPPAGRRKNYILPVLFKKMVELSDQNFSDLLTFAWETGARPQEIWKLTAQHVEEKFKRLCIPVEDTKRRKTDRHIYCTETAWEIVCRLKDAGSFIFTTTTGTQWNKFNVNNRMATLTGHTGKRVAMYDFRHTWITNKLKQGMDIHLVAKLAGTSIAMIERHYDKSDEDAEFMLNAVRSQPLGANG